MKPTSWQECTFAWNCWRLFGWRKKRGVLRWWCFGGKGHGPRVGNVVDEWKVQNLKRHGLRMQIANALIKRSLFHTFVEFMVPWCDMMTRSARWCLTCYCIKFVTCKQMQNHEVKLHVNLNCYIHSEHNILFPVWLREENSGKNHPTAEVWVPGHLYQCLLVAS